jgi:hypothetical protein
LPVLVVAILGLAAPPALAQSSPPAGAPPANPPMRIVGTIDKLDGDLLTAKTKDGPTATATLKADVAIWGMAKSSLADIKPGDFVASGGIKGVDGRIHAVEVRIYPEALRGIGEGQRPWNVKPDGVMTNATVGTVTQSADGNVVHVTYKGGESEFVVGPDVPESTYVAGDKSFLTAGLAIFAVAQKSPDGKVTIARIYVERDGVKPPG